MIKTLDLSNSVYAGKKKTFTEISFRPSPKNDPTTGEVLPPSKRYYVIRPLSFEHGDRTDFPFIIRNEHVFLQRNAENRVTGVETICCPNTSWARQQLIRQGEPVGKGYCPICEFSYSKNKLAWANKPNIDRVAEKLARDTKSVWAAYVPAFIVNDPHYPSNNQHLKVIRITDEEGFLNRLIPAINDAISKGVNVFNGDEGANIWVLCEEVVKQRIGRDGQPSINKKTGQPYEYTMRCITDVRVATKKLYAYPDITDEAIKELHFDDTYGTASNRVALDTFLHKNWLDIGGSDADFEPDFEGGFEDAAPATAAASKTAAAVAQTAAPADDFGDDFGLEAGNGEPATSAQAAGIAQTASVAAAAPQAPVSVEDTITSIIGNSPVASGVKKAAIAPSADAVREEISGGNASFDDLPF